MTEHTPLPWAPQEPDPSEGVAIIGLRTNPNGDPYDSPTNGLVAIVTMLPTEAEVGDTSRAQANAAYIVKACNAFPDLVKALEAFAIHATYPVTTEINSRGYEWRGQEALDYAKGLADAVLAAVKGAPDHG
jgi:hypothetical protein